MNYFYAYPKQISGGIIEISGQEAIHITKVLRNKVGDEILVLDGIGNRYKTEIQEVSKKSVLLSIKETSFEEAPSIKKIMAFGSIKKRDRLEFAIEKAVELDAWEICIFQSEHSERGNLNQERAENIALSAFKQCARTWLPEIKVLKSLDELLRHYSDAAIYIAHEQEIDRISPEELSSERNVLLVGPEGGFSDNEIESVQKAGGKVVSLGKYRLRAETAVAAFLSQYLN